MLDQTRHVFDAVGQVRAVKLGLQMVLFDRCPHSSVSCFPLFVFSLLFAAVGQPSCIARLAGRIHPDSHIEHT